MEHYTALVVSPHLSKEMAQRCSVLTVEACTSMEFQRLHTADPNIHLQQLSPVITGITV